MSRFLKLGSFFKLFKSSGKEKVRPLKPCIRLPRAPATTPPPEPAGWWEQLTSLFGHTKRREARQATEKLSLEGPSSTSPSLPDTVRPGAPAKRVTFAKQKTVQPVSRWIERGKHVWDPRYAEINTHLRREFGLEGSIGKSVELFTGEPMVEEPPRRVRVVEIVPERRPRNASAFVAQALVLAAFCALFTSSLSFYHSL